MASINLTELTEKRNRAGTTYYENSLGDILAKQCTKCKRSKRLDSFHNSKKGFGGRSSYCVECQNSYKSKWKRENQDTEKLYRERNKETISEYRRKYYEENRDYELDRNRRYKESNREVYNTYNRNRKARAANLEGCLTEDQRLTIMSKFKDSCALSGSTLNIHLDHVIPLSVGRVGTIFENMIPLRSDLNISKKDRCIFDWFADNRDRFGLSQRRFDELIAYLAKINGMSVNEYEEYARWCHDNPRDLAEVSLSRMTS